MSEKDVTKDELLEAHMAGGRQNGEQSRALPRHYYGNPADAFEYPSERLRREEAKRRERAKRKGRK